MHNYFISSTKYLLSCLQKFLQQNTVTRDLTQNQELHPRPELCLSYLSKLITGTNITNMTNKEYRQGNWRIQGFSEEELFDKISPNFEDLVNKFIIQRTTSSGKYTKTQDSCD